MRSAVVLGPGTVGLPVVRALLADRWQVTAVARSAPRLAAVRAAGARAVQADVTRRQDLEAALAEAAAAHGGLDLVVNAVNAVSPPAGEPFGGGPVAEASAAALRGYGLSVVEQVHVALGAGIDALRRHGGGTLVQVTGSSSRTPRPGAGCWAVGAFGTRALVEAASAELRDEPVDVCLLVIEGSVQTAAADALTEPVELAEIGSAVSYLATRSSRHCGELFLGAARRPATGAP